MIFWLTLAAMTAITLGFVAWPFVFQTGAARSGGDLAIYRDQLEEIERDRAAGLIAPEESEAARIEVSRRLLKAAGSEQKSAVKPAAGAESGARRGVALGATIAVVALLPAGLYYTLGAPGAMLPKAAMAGGADKAGGAPTLEDMISQIETHLRRKPDDARSWEVLAPVYMRLGRYDDAIASWRNVIRLSGDTAEREENLGESLVATADGVVTADAKAAFDKALSLDKDAVAARYYRGLAAMQDGRRDDAARIWRDMLTSAPPEATWTNTVRQSLDQLEGRTPERPSAATGATSQPDARQMQDVANAPPDQQTEMVRGMVARLAGKLKQNGDDPEGWLRLVRSYGVLGERDKAAAAIADARKALVADSEKLRRFDEGLKTLDPQAN